MDFDPARVDGSRIMKIHFSAPHGIAAAAVLSLFFACKSSSNTLASPADGSGGEATLNEQPSEAGQAGQAGVDGQAGEMAAGGAGSSSMVQRGAIVLTQANVKSEALMIDTANYDLTAVFATYPELTREQAAASVTTVGDCTASVVTIDPNAPGGMVMPRSGLNAGAITVTGIRMPPTLLIDYVDKGTAGPSNYSGVRGDTRFFEDADVISVRGSGGPDLPAFKAQSLKAPSEIAVTAPSCVTGSCPDVDHSKDLLFTWENGGDGKVDVLFETVADAKVVLLECKFDAAKGKGTIPSSLLAKLDVVDGENVSGIEQITPIDELTFLVGDVSTTFSLRLAQYEALLGP